MKTFTSILLLLKKKDVDRSTIYSFSGPFEALQADTADIRFLGRSAADPKYCLLFVDLFTSMIYTYPMKTRNLLAKKMAIFYQDIAKKRTGKMRLQTDREFQQTNIKKLNKQFDVDMYSTNLRGGKAFVAEQKIRELKKLLLRSKRIKKLARKRVKPNELIKKATYNLNNTRSAKYGFSPEQIEKKSLDLIEGQNFRETYDFSRLWRIKEAQGRADRYAKNLDSRKKRRLRDPLDIGEQVLVLAERLKKKDAPGRLYKSTKENRPYFNRNRIFTINKRVSAGNNTYYYWLKEDGQEVKNQLLREELFALNDQFAE